MNKAIASLDRAPDVAPDVGDEMPRFSLNAYELLRDPNETDDEYAARLALFKE